MSVIEKIGPKNEWRMQTSGAPDWSRTARPEDPDKYFMVSADNHVNEPFDWIKGRIDKKYIDRLPRVQKDEEGNEWLHSEGQAPLLVKPVKTKTDHLQKLESYETWEVMMPYTERMEELEIRKAGAARTIEQRLADAKSDGVDAELVYAQKGLMGFATPDPIFASAMCKAWNRWALDEFGEHFGRISPMANIAGGAIDEAIEEVKWAADNGFKGIMLGNKPIFGPTRKGELAYNDRAFEPLWATIAETGLPITFHVSTGEDPRSADGYGGAIINYVSHSMITTMDPLVKLISSGVLERHPTLKVVTVESGVGWIPWLLETMDHSYRCHHMWVRPVIPELPSFYYRRNCASTFLEEPIGLQQAIDAGLEDNLLWASDYPHHEGSWPFSAQSIERYMGGLTDEQRAKVLGLNAARIFDIPVPPKKRH